MDPLDDLEDPTDSEEEEADDAFSSGLNNMVQALAPDVPGMPMEPQDLVPFVDELGGVQDTPPVDSPCPKCGSEMEAEVDPSSLLSFPMRYVWRCTCGHKEARLDKHIIDNPGADASMALRGDDEYDLLS